MIPEKRQYFNQHFSESTYLDIVEHFMQYRFPLEFRISESPIFLTDDLQTKLFEVSDYIIQKIKDTPKAELEKAVPEKLWVPGKVGNPHFLAIDFGICKNEQGDIVPQLIEAQAFPSLYFYQKEYEKQLIENYNFTENPLAPATEAYVELLKKIILGGHPKEEVILLELEPEKQKTAIDFAITEDYLGIESICISQIQKKDRQLFYKNSNGITYPIKRIYNRIIWDELLEKQNLLKEYHLTDEVEVEWATHPNWFFMVSKNILPILKHQYIPESYFIKDFPKTEDISHYVLKPLYSFGGKGVDLHPNQEKLNKISEPENYILQKKVQYAPLFEDINGDFSKAEIRMLFAWDEENENPTYMINLVRMTKADMVNVSFNKKDAIWIGSSMAFFGNT